MLEHFMQKTFRHIKIRETITFETILRMHDKTHKIKFEYNFEHVSDLMRQSKTRMGAVYGVASRI